MDDFYLIVQSKEYAKWCLFAIYEFVHSLGLELNGKTQIIQQYLLKHRDQYYKRIYLYQLLQSNNYIHISR